MWKKSPQKNTKTAFSLRLGEFAIVLLQELFSCSHLVHEFKWFDGQTRFIMIVSSCFEKQPPFKTRDVLDFSDQQGSMIILNTQKMTHWWHHVPCPCTPWSKDFDTNRLSWPTLCFPLENYNETGPVQRLHDICTEHIGFQHLVQWNRSGTAHYNITSPPDSNAYHWCYMFKIKQIIKWWPWCCQVNLVNQPPIDQEGFLLCTPRMLI